MKTSALIILLIIFLAILGVMLYFFPLERDENGLSSCTLEALVCPDGSAVGRTGPECRFEACPTQESFVGTLIEQGGDFRLVIPAPSQIPHAATFALPLDIRVSNALQELVEQRVRVMGEFTEGTLYRVSTLEPLDGDAADPTWGEVSVGGTELINGVKVTLHEVIQDSRCPLDEVCIEGGGITARMTLQSDTDSETQNFASDEAPFPFDAWRVSIERVEPPRLSTTTPDPSLYRLTVRVVPIEM